MYAILWLIDTLLTLAFWIVLIQVIMSWLINFDVINTRQPLVYQIWSGLNRLLDPIYRPIRRFLPNLGGIDLAPMVLIIGILFVQRLILVDLARAVI